MLLAMKPLIRHLLRGAGSVLALFPSEAINGRMTADDGGRAADNGDEVVGVLSFRALQPPVAERSDGEALRRDWQKVFGDLTRAFHRAREL